MLEEFIISVNFFLLLIILSVWTLMDEEYYIIKSILTYIIL